MEQRPAAVQRSKRVRLSCLGNGETSVDGQPVWFRTRKTLGLFAYLALNPGPHPRERIADLLWPDGHGVESRVSLRTALTYLRQALGDAAPAVLIATRDVVGIAHGSIAIDVDVLRRAREASRRHTNDRLRQQIRSAVDRYQSPFLDGLSFDDAPEFDAWLQSQRAHWRGVTAELLSLLATMQEEAGEAWESLASLEQWTAVDPDDEVAWRRLIELHLRLDNHTGARAAWEGYRQALEELDSSPSKVMSELYERIDAHPIVRHEAGVTDVDSRQIPLVGRSPEWEQLENAYRRVQRRRSEIVIISGRAGVGKSRLGHEFTTSIGRHGADVMAARCLQGIGRLPYAPLIAALRARLDAENAPDDLLSDLWLTELARLLPELLERYPDLVVTPADGLTRGRIFEAVSRLGMVLGQRKPLVIFLDDAEWADGGTRDLLQYAIHRWAETATPVLLLLATQLPVNDDLGHWFAALEAETRVTQIEVGQPPAASVTQFVRGSHWPIDLLGEAAGGQMAFAGSGN